MSTLVDRLNGISDGLGRKAPARVATTTNIALSGLQTIDGVTLEEGDRVIVWKQTDATQNGVYEADSGAWTRALDFDGARDVVNGTTIFANDGTTYKLVEFALFFSGSTVSFGTTELTFRPTSVTPLGSLQLDFATDPQFDFAAGVLAQGLYFSTGATVTVPASKQIDFIRNENTVVVGNGGLVSSLNFQKFVSGGNASSNSYGVIGALYNSGALASKAIYGRVVAEEGSTAAALVALTGGVQTRVGVGTSVGVQLSLDSMDGEPVDYGIWIQAGGAAVGAQAICPVDYGILIHDKIAIQTAGLRMFGGVGGSVGSFLHLTNDTGSTDHFVVGHDGTLYVKGVATFDSMIKAYADVELQGEQSTLRWHLGERDWDLQALDAGPGGSAFRITAGPDGDGVGGGDILKLFLGSSRPQIRIEGSLWEITVGAADSAGTGYRTIKALNTPL